MFTVDIKNSNGYTRTGPGCTSAKSEVLPFRATNFKPSSLFCQVFCENLHIPRISGKKMRGVGGRGVGGVFLMAVPISEFLYTRGITSGFVFYQIVGRTAPRLSFCQFRPEISPRRYYLTRDFHH